MLLLLHVQCLYYIKVYNWQRNNSKFFLEHSDGVNTTFPVKDQPRPILYFCKASGTFIEHSLALKLVLLEATRPFYWQ